MIWLRLSVVLVLASPVASCGSRAGEEDDSSAAKSDCSSVHERLLAVCGEIVAETARVECTTYGLTGLTIGCLSALDACARDDLDGCEFSVRSHACSPDDPCAFGLFCDLQLERCVACLIDEHCASNKTCRGGLCLLR